MQVCIQPVVTWSKDHVFAGGTRNIVLLVEWRGAPKSDQGRTNKRKLVARDIELRVWLEPHIALSKLHGCSNQLGDDRSLVLSLGKIQSGQRRYIAMELTSEAVPAGKRDVVWLQWLYKFPLGERIQELPVQKLSLEYSHYTGALNDSCCFHVEKHLELLKNEYAIEKAALLRSMGKQRDAQDTLRRQADKLLLMAARSQDMLLLREAESMYKRSDLEVLPLLPLIEEQIIRSG